MTLKWVDCDLPAPEERTPEQIRKTSSAPGFRPSNRPPPSVSLRRGDTVASFQHSITKEVIWPLMELMESTSPSSYNAVLELDRKIRDLSAAVDIYEDGQFNATAATLEWNCILGANVRQAGEYPLPHFSSVPTYVFFSVGVRGSRSLTDMCRAAVVPIFVAILIAVSFRVRWNGLY